MTFRKSVKAPYFIRPNALGLGFDAAKGVPDLSMRGGDKSIWGGFDVVLPDYNDHKGAAP